MNCNYPDLCALSAPRLAAIALRDEDVIKAFTRFNSLREMEDAPVEDIMAAGVTRQQAESLKAALELGKRLANEPRPKKAIFGAADIAELLGPEMSKHDREHFKVVMLDTRNQVIGVETVAIGTLNMCPAHPREVFKTAILNSAAAVIIAHNHPSGSPSPSPEDIALSKRMQRAGALIGIDVLDSIVIGEAPTYMSLKQMGVL